MSIGQSGAVSLSPFKEHEKLDLNVELGGLEARKKLERRLLRKLDLRMSILVVMYILNYIDRNNVSAARLRGLTTDLHLEGQQFATLLSILLVGYIIMQIPSNMFLNYIGKPSLYLPAFMVVWGIISALTGITTNFTGVLLTRFSLGFVEAAFFPGVVFLISKWFVDYRYYQQMASNFIYRYKRTEIGLRLAILSCGSILSSAFGALIASGILGGMNDDLGHASWRWLFYIEGALTVFVAICAVFIVPDFPLTTRWLSDDERRLALKRMEEDAGVGDETETEQGGRGHGLYLAVTDWKVWWIALATAGQMVSLSFTIYFPTLSATLGYNPTVTLLLVAPPFVIAAIVTLALSMHSDKTQERFYHMSASYIVGIIGFIIALCTTNTVARYLSLFLMAQSNAGLMLLLAWISNTFPRPPSKRAVCFSLINVVAQLGGIAGSYVWPSNWGPTYRYSYGICLAASSTSIIMSWVFRQHLKTLNRKLEQEEQERGIKEQGFRYVL
ncbi:major facilitator superfamily domain-containing protein [Suillus clintonianus]|uniref:major facilitator superfamily domain-containing protein n=1 Tax=Suillus clintonianus TaxID=1904413 RepID=UPI001B86ADF1|nr:major facilitator superfamily domain-containing protein [Suillus clintonianus]KAG2117463.1 major facilitator superfamily domain-containing protein [Suillus clintonianus]